MRDQYPKLYKSFRWHVPQNFNIADVCVRRWAAETSRVAIYAVDAQGNEAHFTYATLLADANRLSNALRALGVQRGDRVALVLPQRAETVIAHMAALQLGAVSVPLSLLFGADALSFRLQDSGAVAAICDDLTVNTLDQLRSACPQLRHIICVQGHAVPNVLDWSRTLQKASDVFTPMDTAACDPALLIYTSGTTGQAKGALLPHSALIGNLPGFVASQNWFPQPSDVFWSPADWAWTGGLMDALLPTLYFGFPIIAYRGRFTPDAAFELMQRFGVTNTFLFPTALKMMMKQVAEPRSRYRLKLRSIMSAGEPVGSAVFDWTQRALGITVNEMFGQTEVNYIVGNSHAKWPAQAGSMGRAYPGHQVSVIDDEGNPLPPGEVGEIAVHRRDMHGTPDPVFFLQYLNNPQATQKKFTGSMDDSWCRTGDLGVRDAEGYFWYRGRVDDVFKVAGYRVGPNEIENCLLQHEAVANAAVVPKPDAERGNLVKAFVVLAMGQAPSPQLIEALQAHVKTRLALYEYPKEIEFIDTLPMTTSGKVQRSVLREREAHTAQPK